MSDLPGVVIKVLRRDELASAEHYILATWIKNYQGTACREHSISERDYRTTHHPEMTRLLYTATVALACAADDPDAFMGWACGSSGVLHYAFVRGICRRSGIGAALIEAACEGPPHAHTFDSPMVRLLYSKQAPLRHHPHPIPALQALQQQKEQQHGLPNHPALCARPHQQAGLRLPGK